MLQMTNVLKAWGTPAFNDTLKNSLERMDVDLLPLQACLTQSVFTTGANRKVEVFNVSDNGDFIHATTGVFYSGVVPGAYCEDDRSPNAEASEYCELVLDIDKKTAETKVSLLPD